MLMDLNNDIRYRIYNLLTIEGYEVDPIRYPDLLSILVETTPRSNKIYIWEHIFNVLLNNGYTPWTYTRPDRKSILHIAIESDNIIAVDKILSIFQYLVEDPPVYSGMNPLHYAIQLRRTNIVNILLRHGYDPEAKTDNVMSPLAIALSNGYTPDILRYLIVNYGVSLRSLDNRDSNILHIVFKYGLSWVMDYFNIDITEYIDEPNREQVTPFEYAVMNNRLDIVRTYITRERVNRVNPITGKTAIFYPISLEMFDMILPLADNINITDRYGRRLINYVINEADDIVDLLLYKGAYILFSDIERLPSHKRSKYDLLLVNRSLRYLYRWEVICSKQNPTDEEIQLLRSAVQFVGGNSNIDSICNYIRSREFSNILNIYQQQWISQHNNTLTTEDMNGRPLWYYDNEQILCITQDNITYCFYIGDLNIRFVEGVYQFQHPYTREVITLNDTQRLQYLRSMSMSSHLNPLGIIFDIIGYIRN